MIGFIVRHPQLGIGKVLGFKNGALQIRFVDSGQVYPLSPQLLASGAMTREFLAVGSRCQHADTICTIKRIHRRPSTPLELCHYELVSTNETAMVVSEVELTPLVNTGAVDPLLLLVGLEVQSYHLFRTREGFASTYARLLHDAAGLRALLASRVDLHPHQAFVAGTVILDPRRRFILADEVGLGKTIEAGIVIHDLLAQKPEARVLVVCPGTLTQQWLSELYGKFSGHIFTLLDLHEPALVSWNSLQLVIVSASMAAYEFGGRLRQVQWDMVVVDEAHHLLVSDILYALLADISRRVPALLLLSAIPAHQREDELLRLLVLLEPERYGDAGSPARSHFAALQGIQSQLGRGLRVLSRRVDGVASGELALGEASEVAEKLLQLPVISADGDLRTRVASLSVSKNPVEELRRFVYDTADRYRLSRRILRNRRRHLVDQKQIAEITRRVQLSPFDPDQFEIELVSTITKLLARAHEQQLDQPTLSALARMLFQATVTPETSLQILSQLQKARARKINDRGRDLIEMGHTIGHTDWAMYCQLVFAAARSAIPDSILLEGIDRANAWQRSNDINPRLISLVKGLSEARALEAVPPKMLVFVGFPGAASRIASSLREEFGDEAITEFRTDLTTDEKERNVARFHRDAATWLLVSDETGGEGRNFQFAAELFHVDTPWHVAHVEQRIGRLDRLGRDQVRPDVSSRVIFNTSSPEAGLVHCYDVGIGVYTGSISGLEFALRDVERTMIEMAIHKGRDGMIEYAQTIAEVIRGERAQDDSEVVLDEASFEHGVAARYRRVAHTDRVDRNLEKATVAYVKALSGGHAIRDLQEPGLAGAVWRVRPEETRYGALPVGEAKVDSLTGNHDGTFRRDVAQQRPSLQFFSIGNPIFDALVRSLDAHGTGRVYALECTAEVDPWLGLEFVFRVAPDVPALHGNLGLLNRAAAPFEMKYAHVFVTLNGDLASDSDALLRIRQSIEVSSEGRAWWDMATGATTVLPAAFANADWEATLMHLYEVGRIEARRSFDPRIALAVDTECGRLAEWERQLAQRGKDGADRVELDPEIAAIELIRQAITGWQVSLDAVGFLSINGQLHELIRDERPGRQPTAR